jgi:hypothetical protein
MDNDGYISNGELYQVLKMMVGNNLKDTQLQQIVDKTILFADKDEDGRISFEEFCSVSSAFISFFLPSPPPPTHFSFLFSCNMSDALYAFYDCFRLLAIQIFIRKW